MDGGDLSATSEGAIGAVAHEMRSEMLAGASPCSALRTNKSL